jgi:hypothetical protein
MINSERQKILDAIEATGYEVESLASGSMMMGSQPSGITRVIDGEELVTTDRVVFTVTKKTRTPIVKGTV